MKKIKTSALSVFLCLLCVICLVSCGEKTDAETLWKDAVYTADTEFGEGSKTVQVQVVAGENSVTFTLHTDAKTLGEALLAHGLIAGDTGEFGLYVKKVNGILADYDVDQSYWAFTKNGETMMTGVDMTEIADGEQYELVYTK